MERVMPGMSRNMPADENLSDSEFITLQRVYLLAGVLSVLLLAYDYVISIPREIKCFWMVKRSVFQVAFLTTRYLAIIWVIFVCSVWVSVGQSDTACSIAKVWPQGYTFIGELATGVMALRVWALLGKSTRVALCLGMLVVSSFAVEVVANLYVQPHLIANQSMSVCFLYPTSMFFVASFIAPSIVHHILLALTLYKAWSYFKESESTGIGSLLRALKRDQTLYVLAICLTNFTNILLVVQGDGFAYKLINMLPVLVVTQILLAKIAFSFKESEERRRRRAAEVSPVTGWDSSTKNNSTDAGSSAKVKGRINEIHIEMDALESKGTTSLYSQTQSHASTALHSKKPQAHPYQNVYTGPSTPPSIGHDDFLQIIHHVPEQPEETDEKIGEPTSPQWDPPNAWRTPVIPDTKRVSSPLSAAGSSLKSTSNLTSELDHIREA